MIDVLPPASSSIPGITAKLSIRLVKQLSYSALRSHICPLQCQLPCFPKRLSGSHGVRQKAHQMLDSITKVSPQNRSLLAQTDVAIATLLTLSKSSSVETLSLCTLFNLSLNPELKGLLQTWKPSSSEYSRLASSLICSSVMLDKKNAKFGVAGTIQLLVKADSGPHGPAAQYYVCSLAQHVQSHGNCTVSVQAGAVPVLMQIVESTDGDQVLAGTSLAFSVSLLGLMGDCIVT